MTEQLKNRNIKSRNIIENVWNCVLITWMYPYVAQNKNVNSMCFNVNLQTSLLRDKKEALKFGKKKKKKKWETELKIVWFQSD